MSPALSRGLKKGVRTLLQLAAGGALTAAVSVLAGGLSPNTKVLVLTAWTVLVALIQNTAETAGKIPALLPAPGLVTEGGPAAGQAVGRVVGTVDVVTETAGGVVETVTGAVTSTTGGVVGAVTGGLLGGGE